MSLYLWVSPISTSNQTVLTTCEVEIYLVGRILAGEDSRVHVSNREGFAELTHLVCAEFLRELLPGVLLGRQAISE